MPAHHRFAAGVNNPPSALMRVTATDNQVFIFLQAANKPFFQLTAHHGFEGNVFDGINYPYRISCLQNFRQQETRLIAGDILHAPTVTVSVNATITTIFMRIMVATAFHYRLIGQFK
ncbi:hypothetical protein HmCmsJML164_01135 [Escherichia coli]|nr:hypothetical protein HmCmsJML164_01135 [Escherichia coli]